MIYGEDYCQLNRGNKIMFLTTNFSKYFECSQDGIVHILIHIINNSITTYLQMFNMFHF